jgi:hypothetical protein
MSSPRWLELSLLGVGLVLGLSSPASAAPWDKLFTTGRVEADPNKTYTLTEDNGPWLIMACSFSGDDAKKQANELVLELRKRYKLAAYVYAKKFDFGDEELARRNQVTPGPRRKYASGPGVEEIAVMVGDYEHIDDATAQRTLHDLKYARPDCLQAKDGKTPSLSLATWRGLQEQARRVLGSKDQEKGPMGHAFVTTNPLRPSSYYANKGIDKLVEKINEDNPYNLLKCPGKYTVQVATFHGQVTIDQLKIRDLERSHNVDGGALAQAGEKAVKLAEALRAKHYEAYVLHDRYASIVTVGSFNSVGTPRPDGRIEINPKIHELMQTFSATPAPGAANGAMMPKTLLGITFDIQAIPVEVPRRSISADYNHDLVGLH